MLSTLFLVCAFVSLVLMLYFIYFKMEIHSKILKRLDMAFIQRAFYVLNPFMLIVPTKIGDDEERYLIDTGVRYIWYWVGFLFLTYLFAFLGIFLD